MPRLAGIDLPANVDTVVYAAPTNKRATVTLSLCNRSQNNAFVSVGLCSKSVNVIGGADYIEYNTNLSPGNTLERTGLTPFDGEKIIVRVNTTGVSAVVWGYTE